MASALKAEKLKSSYSTPISERCSRDHACSSGVLNARLARPLPNVGVEGELRWADPPAVPAPRQQNPPLGRHFVSNR